MTVFLSRRRRMSLAGLAVACLCGGAVLSVKGLTDGMSAFGMGPADFAFLGRFDSVRPGMSRQAVVDLLGQPVHEDVRFELGQKDGHEKEYARAAASGATRWLFWHACEQTCAVGIDADSIVRMTSRGGT